VQKQRPLLQQQYLVETSDSLFTKKTAKLNWQAKEEL
jgi:hypothetical protein